MTIHCNRGDQRRTDMKILEYEIENRKIQNEIVRRIFSSKTVSLIRQNREGWQLNNILF
jgi:hypothetical protein